MYKLLRSFGELRLFMPLWKSNFLYKNGIIVSTYFSKRSTSFGVYHSPSEALGLPQPTILDKEERSAKYFPVHKGSTRGSVNEHLTLTSILRGYQIRGHLAAAIDPLNVKRKKSFRPEFPSRLVMRQHRLPVDREKLYLLPPNTYIGNGQSRMLLGDIIKNLNEKYCDTMGIEFMHDPLSRPMEFIRMRVECGDSLYFTTEEKINILERLTAIDVLENFLKIVTPRDVRLSVSGTETGIIAIQEIINRATKYGADTFIIGMRRIGRLSLLSNVLHKPLEDIFSLIHPYDRGLGKFAYGTYANVPVANTKSGIVRVSLNATCSIPELHHPLALGRVKGMQWREYDTDGDRIWPIIIHGIRELNSQGIVYETLKLSVMEDFSAHGAIHVVFGTRADYKNEENNLNAILSLYCTDVMKVIHAPIMHVNADDVGKIIEAVDIAVEYRSQFKRSVVIHVVGYNRWLNLLPPMSYEQKLLHEATKAAIPVNEQYAENLIRQHIISKSEYKDMVSKKQEQVEEAWKKVKENKHVFDKNQWIDVIPAPRRINRDNLSNPLETGYDKERLVDFSVRLSKEPVGFELHPNDIITFKQRLNMVDKNAFDWVMCEALAFATLLEEGTPVRISGTDINRRRHILKEMTDAKIPRHINLIESLFRYRRQHYRILTNTNSIYATAVFQTGFSLGDLNTFVIWEAPIGDKISKIQPLMDQYVSLAKDKFFLECGIVLYIPHGFSCISTFNVCNGRPERFLQLCNDDEAVINEDMNQQLADSNLIVVNPSTGANLFHVLRRHARLTVKRPLAVFLPEDIMVTPLPLRSSIEEMSGETKFLPIMGDPAIHNYGQITKILLCTGLIYIDLIKQRTVTHFAETIAIIRIEQISPFPYALIKQELAKYPSLVSIFWVQEEPRNQGWWFYIRPRLINISGGIPITVACRPPRPDMGTRFAETCEKEKRMILGQAFADYT